jgi:stress response protein SCP2
MVLNLKENAETKKRVREMQTDFNPFNAQQREHEKMMIRHLQDDDDGDDDDEDVNTKKHKLPPKITKKKKIQSTSIVKQSATSYGKQKKSATLGTYFI